nr:retrovirus-related Pol polyprotein from transposon TNT 1-94 [Tanacetum cinerariifolium]
MDLMTITLTTVSSTLGVKYVVVLHMKHLTVLRNTSTPGDQGLPTSNQNPLFTKRANLYENFCAGLPQDYGDKKGYGSVKCNGITFTRVAYVNGLKHNLISISQSCDANYKVLFTKTQGTIYNKNNEVVPIDPRRRDVYVIDMSSLNKESNVWFFTMASSIVNWLWHKRLSNLNFKNINNLAKHNLISGLPSLNFSKDKNCLAREKGKHHRASFKTKRSFSINKSLHLLHMDLFRHVKPQTINHNKFTLVIVDEYSRGRSPDISYFYVFGYPVHIHNHMDNLGKFDEKANDGLFLGYSLVAKAFRVFNIRRQEIEKIVHVTFSEDDEAISQSNTEGDATNFNENRSFPDDEFLESRSKVTQCPGNTEYFPYILVYENTTPSESPILQPTWLLWCTDGCKECIPEWKNLRGGIKSQLADYDVLYDKVAIFYDNTSVIAISDNLVLHSRTKHMERLKRRPRPSPSYFDGGINPCFENRPPMLNKENYVPWSSRLLWYAKSRPNGMLIHNSIINGPYVRRLIPEPGDPNREVPMNETFHVQTNDELTKKELKQIIADDQSIQTILLGLLEDICAAIDSCETAQEIWLRVRQMMKGSDIGIQEKKAKLFNEWERFNSTDGESIESYYHRFLKLMNDLK